MNILSIAIKEMKHDFRDRRTLLFMLGFPIVLMLILGLALTNAFSSEISVGDVKVAVKDATGGGSLSEAFAGFAKEVGKTGVTFEPLKPGANGREEVENNHVSGYVELTNQGISLYGSSRDAIESNIVQGMLASFTDKYNAAAAVAHRTGQDGDGACNRRKRLYPGIVGRRQPDARFRRLLRAGDDRHGRHVGGDGRGSAHSGRGFAGNGRKACHCPDPKKRDIRRQDVGRDHLELIMRYGDHPVQQIRV